MSYFDQLLQLLFYGIKFRSSSIKYLFKRPRKPYKSYSPYKSLRSCKNIFQYYNIFSTYYPLMNKK